MERPDLDDSETRALKKSIARLIKELRRATRSGTGHPSGMDHHLTKIEALPVYADMGGTLFLRTDLDVYAINIKGEGVEADPAWRCTAYVAAARLFPELAALRLPRPATASDCWMCRRLADRGHGSPCDVCGVCHGLGWVAPELPQHSNVAGRV